MKRITFSILVLQLAMQFGTSSHCYAEDSQAKAPFSIRISTPQQVVAIGSKATINVLLTNTSDHIIGVYLDNSLDSLRCEYQAHVYDAVDKHAKLTKEAWHLSGSKAAPDDKNDYRSYPKMVSIGGGGVVPFRPGDTKETSFDLFGAYNLSPGQYTVWVSRIDPVSKMVVKSNTLTITVTGAIK